MTADGLTISEDSGSLSFDKVGALNNLVAWSLDAPLPVLLMLINGLV